MDPFLDPINTLSGLIERGTAKFEEHVLGEAGELRALWDGLIKQNDVLPTRNADHLSDLDRTIACGLHGDGAPTHKTEGLLTQVCRKAS